MNRTLMVFAAAVILLNGCRSTCCKKPCTSCAPILPAESFSPSTSNSTPEVWLPSTSAPPTATPPASPAAPTPAFPPPPQTSFSQTNPSRIASAPPTIRLEKPEFSETSRRETTSLKSMARTSDGGKALSFVELTPGRLAMGPRPTLDELDRLARSGYRRIYVVGTAASISDSDQRVFTSRGLTFESAPTRIKPDAASYVFADNASQLRNWLIGQIKEADLVSEEVARIRADQLMR